MTRRRNPASPAPHGFTLLEVLVAMGLFTMIGFAVVILMRTGVDMWTSGNRGAQQEDRLEQSLPRLEEDLRHVLVPPQQDRIPFDPKNPDPETEPEAVPPTNRMISGYHSYEIRDKTYQCRYLAFVRDITGLGEIETYVARAGMNSKAESYIDGANDEEEFKKYDHLPTGGAVEVLWIWLPDTNRPGVGAIYRAYRTPIGGPGTLLDPTNHDELKEVEETIRPQPMVTDVILFDMLFWTQFTTHWEWARNEPSIIDRPRDAKDAEGGARECGPSRTWDSTRGLLQAAGPTGFRLAKPKSLNFTSDDIWPRMVRVEFALAEDKSELAKPLSGSETEFTVLASDFATGRGDLFGKLMKIGPEWLRIQGRDGARRDTFLIDRRGLRGTTSIGHAEASEVFYGRVFDFTITVPSFRDDNN